MKVRSLLLFLAWLGVGVAGFLVVYPNMLEVRSAGRGGDNSSAFDKVMSALPNTAAAAAVDEDEVYAQAAPAHDLSGGNRYEDPTEQAYREYLREQKDRLKEKAKADVGTGLKRLFGKKNASPSSAVGAGAARPRREVDAQADVTPSEVIQLEPVVVEGPGASAIDDEVAACGDSWDEGDPFAKIDRKLADLPLGNIAFNTPEKIPYGDMATIELLVSLRETEQQLRQAIREMGPVESGRVSLSHRMEARLTGAGFQVEAITPEVQALSRQERTQWLWQIEPTKAQTLELHLTLSALLTFDGEPMTRAVRTFERTIVVDVSLETRVAHFLSEHSEWVLPGLLLPLLGALYQRYRKRRAKPSQTTSESLNEAA